MGRIAFLCILGWASTGGAWVNTPSGGRFVGSSSTNLHGPSFNTPHTCVTKACDVLKNGPYARARALEYAPGVSGGTFGHAEYRRTRVVARYDQLPPPNNRDPRGSITDELVGLGVTVAGLGLLFYTPLGALLFALVNSFIILAVSVPVIAYFAYNIYVKTQFVEGECPRCGAAAVAPRDGEPSRCLSCGTLLCVDINKKELEVFDVGPEPSASAFDDLFEAFMGGRGTMRQGEEVRAESERREGGGSGTSAKDGDFVDVDIVE